MGIFDPQPATGNSFLDRLLAANANASIANQPIGAPGDTADYSSLAMQPFDSATGNTIQSAPMPPVQPMATAPVAPVQPTPASPLATPGIQAAAGEFGNHLMTAYQNMHNGGGLIGSVVSAITGQRNDPQAQAQALALAKQQQLYTAMVNAGVPKERAALAAQNPEAAKTILGEAFGPDQYAVTQTGENGLGAKTFQLFNKHTGDLKPINSAPGADAPSGLGDTSLTGQAYLASIPPAQRGTVQAMVEGRMAPPSSFAQGKPYWQSMIAAAQNVDPTFDATQWGGRVAGVKDFSAGKSSEMVRSANQTIGHIGDLTAKMDALSNGSYPLANKVGNYFSSNTGGAAVTGFNQTAHAVADELSKVFKGQGISDAEIRQWEQNLSPDMSPAQQHEAVSTAMSLLQHSLSALEEKRLSSIGPMAAAKQGPLLKPDAQAAVAKIQAWANGKANESAAAPTTTKTGVSWSVVQ